MIVIHGILSVDPASEADLLAAVGPLVETTNQEAGCVAYIFSKDLAVPGTVHIFEEWESDEALKAHMAADHYRTFGRALRGLGVTSSVIHRYEATQRSKL